MTDSQLHVGLDSRMSAAAELLGPLATLGVSLRTLTTFRVGGAADILVRVNSLADMSVVADAVRTTGVPVLVVGQGSNLLVSDEGVRAIVVILGGEFGETTFPTVDDGAESDSLELTAGGGVKLPVLARQAASRGIGGLEWMVGVPGSVGGAVRMNAGGHGSDVAHNLIRVALWSLDERKVTVRDAQSLHLGYRNSDLRDSDVVLTATFQVTTCDPSGAEAELSEIVRWRREHQPGGANCGSVFTNPPGDSAGRLIDAAGLRGLRLGTAAVSEKHANFIQADEDASAADIWALIIAVRSRVFDTFGVVLHPEVRTAGFDAVVPDLPPN